MDCGDRDEARDGDRDLHEWQVEHIKAGVRQADRGEFGSDLEVADAFDRWRN